MNPGKNPTLLLAAAALLAASAQAQTTITPLIVETDVLPIGAVTAIYNVDVNDSGDWLVELDTDNSDTSLDTGVVHNGTLIYSEGTDLGFPPSHAGTWVYASTVDTMDINDNGDILILLRVMDPNAVLADRYVAFWTSGSTGVTYPILETSVTPNTVAGEPTGAVWDSINEVWQNNNNEFIIAGRSNSDDDDMLVRVDHDGLGNITAQTLFAIDNVVHDVAFPPSDGTHADTVQGFTTSKQNIAFNNAGQKFFYVDDESYGPGGVPDYTDVDSHYYIDFTEIAWEADTAPTLDGPYAYNHLSSAEVDLNDSGSWVAIWDDDGPTDRDFFLVKDGVVLQQEGSPPPGITGGWVITGASWGPVQISDAGDVTWMCDWDDPNTDIDSGLYRNNQLIVQEGVTDIGGVLIDTISTSPDGMAVSDSGRYIIHEFTIDGGGEGAYLVELQLFNSYCPGDGIAPHTPCPFGNNNDGSMGGCDWGDPGFTSGGMLIATGSGSVSAADTFLHASAVENNFGIFFEADNQVNGGNGNPLNDGLRCAGGGLVRLTPPTTAVGNAASTPAPLQTLGSTATPGNYKRYQYWFRTPNGPGGQMANLTNGIEILWTL